MKLQDLAVAIIAMFIAPVGFVLLWDGHGTLRALLIVIATGLVVFIINLYIKKGNLSYDQSPKTSGFKGIITLILRTLWTGLYYGVLTLFFGFLIMVGIYLYSERGSLERSREGATKGNLSSIRASIAIYYSEKGVFPDDLTTSFTSYLYPIPPAKATPLGNSNKVVLVKAPPTEKGIGWAYVNDPKSVYYGNVFVNSIATDTKAKSFSPY